jgi:hypothetical protein
MKLTIETLVGEKNPSLDTFEGYIICLHKRVADVTGFMLLGFLQELWVPVSMLTMRQVKCLLRVERDRRKRYPLVLSKKRKK